jgi:hypothetical protein
MLTLKRIRLGNAFDLDCNASRVESAVNFT